jgi:hypothetical protein
MSDETNVVELEQENPSVEGAEENGNSQVTTAIKDMGGYTLRLEGIDEGKWKGFKFWTVEFKDLNFAIEHFTKLSKGGKDGEEVVLGLLNSAMAGRGRSKANSKLQLKAKTVVGKQAEIAEREAWLKDPVASILVTEEDASEYVPGERETSSLSGMLKQKTDLIKAITKLKKDGDLDNARLQRDKYLELCAQIEAKQKEEQDDILASLD